MLQAEAPQLSAWEAAPEHGICCVHNFWNLHGLPRQELLNQQEYGPEAGVGLNSASTSGGNNFIFKAVPNYSLKSLLEMHFALLVLVLCMEIPRSPAAGTAKWGE